MTRAEPGETSVLRSLDRALPPAARGLFDERFVRSHALYGEFVRRLSVGVAARARLFEAAEEPGTAEEIRGRLGLPEARARIPIEWLLREIAAQGGLESPSLPGREVGGGAEAGRETGSLPVGGRPTGDSAPLLPGEPAPVSPGLLAPLPPGAPGTVPPGESAAPSPAARYRTVRGAPRPDPAEIRAAQEALDPSWLPAYEAAEIAAAAYPGFLRGEVGGEEILFSPSRTDLWSRYFSNAHGLYRVNNRLAAVAADLWTATGPAGHGPGGGRPLTILELGGGLGSAGEALVEQFRLSTRLGDIGRYRFTDIVLAFVRRGGAALRAAAGPGGAPIEPSRLDIDRSFEPQGVPAGSVDLVFAVNTLHVARDLASTLREIERALAPGGWLILGECVRSSPDEPIYAEFVFNLLEAFRTTRLDPETRPRPGFLTREEWRRALERAGLAGIRFMPDPRFAGEALPEIYVTAIGACRRREGSSQNG